MARWKLTLEYEGTRYVGWQVQPNGPSIQAELGAAVGKLVGHAVEVVAAGRTDAGVHAEGQVVAFDTPRDLPEKAFRVGLNGLLPADIAVVAASEVDPAFDPRRWATGKRYRYRLSNRPGRSPLRRLTHWEVYQPLDVGAMARAATHLIGRHDFSAFRASNCEAKHAVRELRRVSVEGSPGDEVCFVVEGTAFLKHMVRNLVGSLVLVGRGRKEPEWIAQVLAGRDRRAAGQTAPPHGLTLVEVFYGPRARAEESEWE